MLPLFAVADDRPDSKSIGISVQNGWVTVVPASANTRRAGWKKSRRGWRGNDVKRAAPSSAHPH
jgi:hypothetical protein